METLIELAIAGVFILILLTFLFLFSWMIHLFISTTECKTWGWGRYSHFKKEFKKLDNEYGWGNRGWGYTSLFTNDHSYSAIGFIHASVIKFNNIGMAISDPISYALVKIFIYRYNKKIIAKIPRHKW